MKTLETSKHSISRPRLTSIGKRQEL